MTNEDHPRRRRDYGAGVATTVRLDRDGVRKTHIVIDSVIANGLLADDQSEWANALQIFVRMLARVAFTARCEGQEVSHSSVELSVIAKLLHGCIATAPSDYYSARASAFADPAADERYATLVMDSLASMRRAVESARLQYRVHSNVDDFLNEALPSVSFFLGHAAEWLGHRDGLPERDQLVTDTLLAKLREFELDKWLELFGRDLRALFSEDGLFTGIRISELSRHVERLLWTVQVFPWPMENGSVYVSVPLGNDGVLLESAAVANATETGLPS